MANIGFDVDGVAYCFIEALRKSIHASTGRPLEEMPDAIAWDFFKTGWGYSAEEYHDFLVAGIRDGDLMWEGDCIPGAQEAITYLHDVRGDNITFITARDYRGLDIGISKAATEHWLTKSGIPYDNVIITNEKTGYGFDVLFDDGPHNIEAATMAGENAVLFDQPWNRYLDWAPRVHGWKGVVEYMEKRFPRKLQDLG